MNSQLAVQTSTGTHRFSGKQLAWWALSFFGFPIGGLVAETIVGPIDAVWVAVAAGTIAGLAIGLAQWLVLRAVGIDARWIALTAVGLAIGLGVGVAIFDYGTSIGDLAVLGAVSGLCVGAAQWLVLRDHVGCEPALDPRARRVLGARLDDHHVDRCRRGIEVGGLRRFGRDHRDPAVRRPPVVPLSPGLVGRSAG